jgi:hypothetical protein
MRMVGNARVPGLEALQFANDPAPLRNLQSLRRAIVSPRPNLYSADSVHVAQPYAVSVLKTTYTVKPVPVFLGLFSDSHLSTPTISFIASDTSP